MRGMADSGDARPDETAPWSALDRDAAIVHTPCGAGQMVWRVWGSGEPLVLLHGGAGSWLHWLRTIAAFRGERMVVAPDLPGLGASADPPAGQADGGASIVAAGLDAVVGTGVQADLVGFSFGGFIGGMVASARPVRSLALVGSGGLGVIRRTARLERVRDKQRAEREAAHRTNLHRWMIADPSRIDDTAIAIQDWNSRHARLDSRPFGGGDALLQTLPRTTCRLAGIWGAHDHAVQGDTGRARAVLQSIRPGAPFHVVANAGHWVAYEASDAFATALRRVLNVDSVAMESSLHENA